MFADVYFFGGIMKISGYIKSLTRFEKCLWLVSVSVITTSFLISGGGDFLSLTASLIGVTSLIFIAKGFVLGQILMVAFSAFYGIISFFFSYYGEMITYLGMTAPMAVMSVVSWIKHPFKKTKEVEVARVTKAQIALMIVLTVAVTALFYFILKALGNASLIISTVSVTTSFAAAYLTFLRSEFYALGYAANDIVLIILWIIAAMTDISCLPMVFCFVMFLFNDLYGFYSWRKMRKRQGSAS